MCFLATQSVGKSCSLSTCVNEMIVFAVRAKDQSIKIDLPSLGNFLRIFKHCIEQLIIKDFRIFWFFLAKQILLLRSKRDPLRFAFGLPNFIQRRSKVIFFFFSTS